MAGLRAAVALPGGTLGVVVCHRAREVAVGVRLVPQVLRFLLGDFEGSG